MITLVVDDAKDCHPKYVWNRRPKELIDLLKESFSIQVDIIRQSDCTQLELINDCSNESVKHRRNMKKIKVSFNIDRNLSKNRHSISPWKKNHYQVKI